MKRICHRGSLRRCGLILVLSCAGLTSPAHAQVFPVNAGLSRHAAQVSREALATSGDALSADAPRQATIDQAFAHQSAPNAPPRVTVANAGPVAVFTAGCNVLTCAFDATPSIDPDGIIVGVAWDFGDGKTATGATVSHDYSVRATGTFAVTVTVTDDQGATGKLTGSITVSVSNTPPNAAFGASCNGLVCSFDASSSNDPDGNIASFAWDFGDGQSGAGVKPSVSFANAGSFAVSLTVTDDSNALAFTSQAVTVAAANVPPLAAFSVTCNGVTCVFDATASNDPDGNIASYAWDFGDGQNASGASVTHTFAGGGTYTVTLTVTDDQGAAAVTTVSILVSLANQAPKAEFVFDCDHLSCQFDATLSSDSDGSIGSYSWSFGDGSTGNGVKIFHTFPQVKTYPVTLSVTDNDGAQNSTVRQVPAGTPFSPAISGLWYDPSLNGEGYNLISSPAGQVLFYYGHDDSGNRLWLISEILPRVFLPGDPATFTLFQGSGGTFSNPAPSSTALSPWGTMTVTLYSCTDGRIVLDGNDGNKTSLITHLAGIAGAYCITPPATAKAAPLGFSGLWFDPALDGEGYNVIQSPAGLIIFYYGYRSAGGRLWMISETFTGNIAFGQPISLSLFRAQPGQFDNPNPQLTLWGTLDVMFDDCSNGVISLSGPNHLTKTSKIVLLASAAHYPQVARQSAPAESGQGAPCRQWLSPCQAAQRGPGSAGALPVGKPKTCHLRCCALS